MMMRSKFPRRLAPAALLALCAAAAAFDAPRHVAKAAELLEAGQFAFARTWLAPALIAPQLRPALRSRAYYLRGVSFQAQGLDASATQDYVRALEYDPENAVALYALGDLHLRGAGAHPDQALAFAFFREAATLGNAVAQFQTGWAYLSGAGVSPDPEQARSWLKRAADQGHGAAMTRLAASHRAPYADRPNPTLAQHWYERAADAGDADALAALGFMARNGELDASSAQEAAGYFRQAANMGSAVGSVNLAHAHLTGQGVPVDYAAARVLFAEAAEQGVAGSFVGLGHIYEAGLGVAQDADEALVWYRRGAQAGHSRATLRLVRRLVAKGDVDEAARWLETLPMAADAEVLNAYAWVRATATETTLRNGRLALIHARRALAAQRNASRLDTLAAAYAELGRFAEAVATQRQALALAGEDGAVVDEMNAHLAAYLNGLPWRE